MSVFNDFILLMSLFYLVMISLFYLMILSIDVIYSCCLHACKLQAGTLRHSASYVRTVHVHSVHTMPLCCYSGNAYEKVGRVILGLSLLCRE